MPKIAFIGAGSLGFTRALARDILTFPLLRGSTLALVDINPERLEFARRGVQTIIDRGRYPARVTATLDRRAALRGADVVLCMILSHRVNVFRHDIEIPKRYGVDTNVGDTRGPSGVFRALRTIPVMLGLGRDMERHCPGATLLNYTNPMAMLCRALQRSASIRLAGLCHSVQGTAGMLAEWIHAPMDRISYLCAGINHQAWFLKFLKDGRDAYPLIRRAVRRPEFYRRELVRNEMFLALGYYVSESSGHNSEYNWWFRKRPDLIRKYCHPGTGWNPGRYGFTLREYERGDRSWKRWARDWFARGAPFPLARGQEYAAHIINALLGGERYEFNGNVANTGLIRNLPENACVEVPVLADRRGFTPLYAGALPPQCAALNQVNVAVEEMAVEAALTGDPTLVFRAIAYDPLTAAVLSLAEIRKMTTEMLKQNRPHLPQFRRFTP